MTTDNSGTPYVPHVVLTSAYDPVNDRTSLSATINGTPDFLNNYTFDADQRMTDETQTGQQGGNGVDPKQIEFYYNALGQFTNVARYNFVGVGPMVDVATGAFTYDGGNRMTGLNYSYDGGQHAIDAYTWGFDNANLVTSVNSTVDGTASYGYDPTDQLTSATYTGTNAPPNAAYSYSKNGNRTMTGYSTGTDNLVASDGTFNYGYDGEGNRTLRTRISNAEANDYQTKYIYDYRNRLTDEEYFNNSGTLTKHVHYVYDTMDREIGKQVDDTGSGSYDRSEWYAYDGSQPVEQFDGSGNLTIRDFNGPSPAGVDAVMAQEPIVTQGHAGGSNWDLADNLGTMRYMVSDASAVVDHVITDAFGQTTSESNTLASHWDGFTGGHTDADTGDVLNGERRYDTTTGAWQTKDPIGLAGGDANTGRYADNTPTNAVDRNGEEITPAQAAAVMFFPWAAFFILVEAPEQQAKAAADHAAMAQQQAVMAQHQAMMAQQQMVLGQQQMAMAQQEQVAMIDQQAANAQQQGFAAQQAQQAGALQAAAGQQAMQQFAQQQALAAVAPAPPVAMGPGPNDGMVGGAVAGVGIGAIMGGLGTTMVVVGGFIFVGTPIGWAGAVVIVTGVGVGMLAGGAVGALNGNGAPNFNTGAMAAATSWTTWVAPFVVGVSWGFGWHPPVHPPVVPPPPPMAL